MKVGAVELNRALESLAQRRGRPPSEYLLDTRRIGVEVADIDRLLFRRPFDETVAATAGHRDEQLDEIAMRDRFDSADVQHLPVRGVARSGTQECIGRVVHVDEITQLRPVTIDLDLAILDGEPDEPRDETLAIVLDQLSWPVDVRESQRACAYAEHVVVQEVVVLAGGLVDPVHVGWLDEVLLGHGQRVRAAVHLSGSREDDLHGWIVAAAGLEDEQLAAAVDLEVGIRILHAVDVADLSREIEDDVLLAYQVVHRALLP